VSGHGKHRKRRRGTHKRRRSPETLLWNREHMPPPPPPWMDGETYTKLVRLRMKMDTEVA
jgi:hypothetical protein